MKKRSNLVEAAMYRKQIVILLIVCLVSLGVAGLVKMNKNEFPNMTIRQGIVVAVYPGLSADEIEKKLAKQLEDYVFEYKEVKKAKTKTVCRDGLCIMQVYLNDNVNDKDEFWSKFKHGLNAFKAELPPGVAALQVIDDFGDTTALLITLESEDKTYGELEEYLDRLKDRLRSIESVGRLNTYGMQKEQIAVYIDNEKLTKYGIDDKSLILDLTAKRFVTTAGSLKSDENKIPIYVDAGINSVREIENTVIFSDHVGNMVRLRDVAEVVREYPKDESFITNNGKKCLLLGIEMKEGCNIVDMGKSVESVLEDFDKDLPEEVAVSTITNQSEVVDDSVKTFLREFLIAIISVIIVVMLFLPLRVALISAVTIPVTIFIAISVFYIFDIEFNTVTLAALMVTLGMVVDDSIVIIDNYLELISEGEDRWRAAVDSATKLFKSVSSATFAISITFFPFIFTLKGVMRDFVFNFPIAMTIILFISLLNAELLVPSLLYGFIKRPSEKKNGRFRSPMMYMQKYYEAVLGKCFGHRKATIAIGLAAILVGGILFFALPRKIMPYAERNQFAVEIYMPSSAAIDETVKVADSLEHIIRQDKRVVSVTSFKGCSSPRFHAGYAPQLAGSNYAQFIVNTESNEATKQLLDYLTPKYSDAFANAYVRFKQLSYGEVVYPLEIRLSGDSDEELKKVATKLLSVLRSRPNLCQVKSDVCDPLPSITIKPDNELASRLSVNSIDLEIAMAMRYGGVINMGSAWEGDKQTPIVLKTKQTDRNTVEEIKEEQIPTHVGFSVPLRQIADIETRIDNSQKTRINGIKTVSIVADVKRGVNVTDEIADISALIDKEKLPSGVRLEYGGSKQEDDEVLPAIMKALALSVVIIFFILLTHFGKIITALFILANLALCIFGAAIGIKLQGIDVSLTCILGLVSLMGILVRNAIIMIDYAEELHEKEHYSIKESIYHSAIRRMRPIVLTSSAAAVGVVPMVLGGNSLWMPMGTVILYGTFITMLFILTVLPVSYSVLMSALQRKNNRKQESNLQTSKA